MSYFKHIKQDVVVDTHNSSVVNLAVGNGYTFTGAATSTLGVAGIQVALKTDKNCVVQIQQSPDNTNWDIVNSFIYYYSKGGRAWTIQAVSAFVRVVVTTANPSSQTTTYFRLQTILCPIVEAIPIATDEDGFLQVALKGNKDGYGYESENTPMGEQRVVEPVRLIGTGFGGTFDTNFWTKTEANGATLTQSNNQAVMASGTNAAGSVKLNSVRRARYIAGSANVFRAVVQPGDLGSANNKRRWGIALGTYTTPPFTITAVTDGAWYQLDGTTFSVVTMRGGVETKVDSGSFNGDIGSDYSISTNAVVYEIYWTNSTVWFSINGKILHKLSSLATTWAATMSFYAYADNVNTGNVTNVSLYIRVASIRRLGTAESVATSFTISSAGTYILKYGPGTMHRVNVLNNAGTIELYDGTSVATAVRTFGTIDAVKVLGSLAFDAPFDMGLTVVTTDGATCTIMYE